MTLRYKEKIMFPIKKNKWGFNNKYSKKGKLPSVFVRICD